ncbi:MAG TPA: DUF177 domain-containing protein [Burkholderiales bacterium]|nr:DUF177 domain-containing protein [Burkholderiales bacterium]
MLMSEQTVIDGFEFARLGKSLHGKMEVSRFERLADSLYSNSGQVDYAISGEIGDEGKHLLHIAITGMLHLRCQRCLGDIEYPLDLNASLMLLKDESDLVSIEDEDPDVDGVVVKDKMEILSMIEDEILLDLPFSPKHEACEGKVERESPFSVLKGRV